MSSLLDRLHRVAFYLFMLSGMGMGLSVAIEGGRKFGYAASLTSGLCVVSLFVLLPLTIAKMLQDEKIKTS